MGSTTAHLCLYSVYSKMTYALTAGLWQWYRPPQTSCGVSIFHYWFYWLLSFLLSTI